MSVTVPDGKASMTPMALQIRNTLILVLAACIWGSAFVAQSIGAEHVGTFTYLAIRSWLAGCTLLPLAIPRLRLESHRLMTGALLRGGLACGTILFVASAAQQEGVAHTTTAKAGFITALYILIVPVVGVLLGRRAGPRLWLGIIMSLVGLYLLCITGPITIEKGDALILLCAIVLAGHILIIARISPNVDGILLSLMQFLVCAAMATVGMIAFETPTFDAIMTAGPSIAYAGVLSGGIGYTLQIIGQKGLDPTIASLAMSLEGVFAALSGWLVLDQTLTCRELTGCTLMFAAIIVAQLPERQR